MKNENIGGIVFYKRLHLSVKCLYFHVFVCRSDCHSLSCSCSFQSWCRLWILRRSHSCRAVGPILWLWTTRVRCLPGEPVKGGNSAWGPPRQLFESQGEVVVHQTELRCDGMKGFEEIEDQAVNMMDKRNKFSMRSACRSLLNQKRSCNLFPQIYNAKQFASFLSLFNY